MKQCPTCKTTYTDETLSFCLADGAALIPVGETEQPTQISYGRNPLQVNIPPNTVPNTFAPNTVQNAPRRSVFPYLIIAVLAFLLVGAIAAGVLIYLNPFGKPETVASNTNANVKTNSNGNDQSKELQEKLANLEKRLQEQNQKKTAQPVQPPKTTVDPGRPTARVIPTGDGFLSLRTEPSVKTGTQLVKIPSNSTVNLENCETNYVTIGGRRGRWCMVTYNGQTGWVFDAFLSY